MSRRPLQPPDAALRRKRKRMAPGGAMWSESPVRLPLPKVRNAGAEEVAQAATAPPRRRRRTTTTAAQRRRMTWPSRSSPW